MELEPKDICSCGSGLEYANCCFKSAEDQKSDWKVEDMKFNFFASDEDYEIIDEWFHSFHEVTDLEERKNYIIKFASEYPHLVRLFELEDDILKEFEDDEDHIE